jgi:hypothetical protein
VTQLRALLVLLVSAGILVLTPSPSWACSCAMSTPEKQVELAGTVAVGTVDWTATDGQKRTYQVTVDRVYKGAAARSEKLLTGANEGSCGLAHLATGKRYVFFIDGVHPGAMRVGLCGGTTAYTAALAHQVESASGPPHAPLPSPAGDAAPPADHSTRTLVLGLGAVAVLLAAAGAVVVGRRT